MRKFIQFTLTSTRAATVLLLALLTLAATPARAEGTDGFTQDGDTYTIHTAEGWNVFCDALQDNDTYNRFSGKTVKLGTADEPATDDRVAPFSYVSTTKANPSDAADSPAAIRRLNVVANIYTSGQYAAGRPEDPRPAHPQHRHPAPDHHRATDR